MTSQPITGWEVKLFQHAMCYPIEGLGSDFISTCSAFKTPPIKEPTKTQRGKRERIESALSKLLNMSSQSK